MGKRKFNEKKRRQVETVVDNSETKKIKLELPSETDACDISYGQQDDANMLVLPSKKRATKVRPQHQTVTRILSKKQRKRLEKIVDQKRKKENHASLMAALVEVQAAANKVTNLTKLSDIQTKGLKQHFKEERHGVTVVERSETNTDGTSAIKTRTVVGMRRKRLALLRSSMPQNEKEQQNLNVVGLDEESSSSSSSGESASENENEEEKESNNGDDEDVEQTDAIMSVNNKTNELVPSNEKNDKLEDQQLTKPAAKTSLAKETPIDRKPAVYVHINRHPEIQAARLKLPILAEEQMIMETISENMVTIIAGETGSGKTTQIPQFLYEAGYAERGMIGVTEPRRVAAISMAKRVGYEMNVPSSLVSYLIRFEGNVTADSKIKFMTDGVLLKEIESDFLLQCYSVIILDEAHERSVYTDILVGLLSRIVRVRARQANPLKVIIMSATLRVADFTENKKLFLNVTPPVITVESRQYPVSVHFSKVTAEDYVREAYRKVLKIHSTMPDGGILVFLTGQKEVHWMVKKLRKAFPYNPTEVKSNSVRVSHQNNVPTNAASDEETSSEKEDDALFETLNGRRNRKMRKKKRASQATYQSLPVINLDSYDVPMEDDTEGDLTEQLASRRGDGDDSADPDSDSENEFDEDLNTSELRSKQPLWVLPLYSMLSPAKQQQIFETPPDGTRLCVISTNVAETSLTIPGIKYVVDSGRQKTKLYDKVTGMTAFVVTFASKAAANQRAGRAGRISAGHCYRLYSSAVYNDEFPDFSPPEVQQKPVDGLVLQMKCMGIDRVANFPFPSPPDPVQLDQAERRLLQLDALEEAIATGGGLVKSHALTRVTPLGRTIAAFPVAPRFGKMLALSHQQGLLPYTICLVAALAVQEVLQEVSLTEDGGDNGKGDEGGNRWRQKRKAWAGTGESLLLGDPMILLRAVGAAEYANSRGLLDEFCSANGIRVKAVREIRKMRLQLTHAVNANMQGLNLVVDPQMPSPDSNQIKLLRQLLFIGMADQIARKATAVGGDAKLKHAYHLPHIDDPVFLHASSVLRRSNAEWVCYQEAFETIVGERTKMFIRGITVIDPDWLPKFVPNMCSTVTVMEDPEPTYDMTTDSIECCVTATIGKAGWQLPPARVEMPRDMLRCRYLLKFFLSGQLFGKLKAFRKVLLSNADSVLKQHATAVGRIDVALKVLFGNGVFDRQRFFDLWQTDAQFFLREYQQFLPASCHKDVASLWPPRPGI